MDEVEQVSHLIGDIYDAALDASLWPGVLEKTGGYMGAACAVLTAQNVVSKKTDIFHAWGIDLHYAKMLDEGYGKINPIVIPSVLSAELGVVYVMSDFVPYEEIIATRFYREWVVPQGLDDLITVLLDKSATSYAPLGIMRHRHLGRWDDESKRRLGLLASHFRRAVLIGNVIDYHKVEAASLADAIDGIAAGVFLVEADSRLVHSNRSGQAMLDAGSVVRSGGDTLVAVDAQGRKALSEALAALTSGNAVLGPRGHGIPLTGRDGERHVAHILPLTSGARRQAGTAYAAVAAVFVHKAGIDRPSPLEAIARHFGLTPRELSVWLSIVEIGGVPEVASVLGISEATVKTHLARLFEKTGTNRQADLVKVLVGFANPLMQ
jgi:DNA-binding CsgD family transcriptional regulator